MAKKQRRYPKAFNKYWEDVEYCGIDYVDDFKYEAYLAWKAGTMNGPIRKIYKPVFPRGRGNQLT